MTAAILALGARELAAAGAFYPSDSDFFRQLAPIQDIASLQAASQQPSESAPPGFSRVPQASSQEIDLLRQGRKTLDSISDMERQGMGFAAIFRSLCENALRSKADSGTALREMFEGLMLWTKNGGRPVLMGREDWALHFIYGGWLASAYGVIAAETAGYHKELKDAFSPNNSFDLDDLAVTVLGARWAGRAELKSWANGRRNLEALPSLNFGMLPPQKIPSGRQLEAVSQWADSALKK